MVTVKSDNSRHRDFLSKKLGRLDRLRQELSPPVGGWIKSIRTALGMNTRQLGERLGVGGDRVRVLEREEIRGAVTLRSMQRAADAMNCEFVYVFLPRDSLHATVEKQARKVAERRVKRVSHSMMLEKQQPGRSDEEAMTKELVQELLRTMPRTLWDE